MVDEDIIENALADLTFMKMVLFPLVQFEPSKGRVEKATVLDVSRCHQWHPQLSRLFLRVVSPFALSLLLERPPGMRALVALLNVSKFVSLKLHSPVSEIPNDSGKNVDLVFFHWDRILPHAPSRRRATCKCDAETRPG